LMKLPLGSYVSLQNMLEGITDRDCPKITYSYLREWRHLFHAWRSLPCECSHIVSHRHSVFFSRESVGVRGFGSSVTTLQPIRCRYLQHICPLAAGPLSPPDDTSIYIYNTHVQHTHTHTHTQIEIWIDTYTHRDSDRHTDKQTVTQWARGKI
jgi:hypothetical protein